MRRIIKAAASLLLSAAMALSCAATAFAANDAQYADSNFEIALEELFDSGALYDAYEQTSALADKVISLANGNYSANKVADAYEEYYVSSFYLRECIDNYASEALFVYYTKLSEPYYNNYA